jgi:hypothetical protein
MAMTTQASMASDNPRIIFLDFLRIFAFVSVLAGHKFYLQSVALFNDESAHGTLREIMGVVLHLIAGGRCRSSCFLSRLGLHHYARAAKGKTDRFLYKETL